MFVRSARESPSVVSTRVLRTHRKNSVENFRLQERVKTIDFESKHNYSQISDEIDGVRQNLVKIKGVKKNVGVSVERRKLLRDKGLRILPVKHNDKDDYFKVRTPQGKDVIISCSDFYDGETMRKRLSIDVHESARTPCLDVENSDGEELLDFGLPESRNRRHTISLDRPFRYRNITPPLRPGSRRNFKDVEEKNSEDEEKLLEKLSSMERKYGILRPQTAYLRERDRQASPRPRSRTCPAEVQSGETTSAPYRKISRKNSGIVGNTRKKSRGNPSVDNETSTTTKTTEEQMLQAKGSQQEVCMNTNVVLEETIPLSPSVRPGLRAKSMTVGSGQPHSGISRTVVGIRRMSLDRDKSIRLPSSPSAGRWFQPDTPEFTPVNEDNEKVERKLSKFTERKVSWKDNLNDDRKSRIDESSLFNGSPTPSTESFAVRDGRKESVMSTKSRTSCDVRAQSAPHSRLSSRKVSRRSSHNFAYDAQPDKALTKGYVTMQMTIGNKQVKVYVPKFSTDCLDDVVERARAKSAVKAVGNQGRPLKNRR